MFAADNPEKAPSFTKEAPVRFVQQPVPFPFDHDAWRSRAAALSSVFKSYPEIFDSEVRVSADKVVRLQTSSEGTEIITEDTIYGVHVEGATRASDGQLLDDSRDWYAMGEAGLEEVPDPSER